MLSLPNKRAYFMQMSSVVDIFFGTGALSRNKCVTAQAMVGNDMLGMWGIHIFHQPAVTARMPSGVLRASYT